MRAERSKCIDKKINLNMERISVFLGLSDICICSNAMFSETNIISCRHYIALGGGMKYLHMYDGINTQT